MTSDPASNIAGSLAFWKLSKRIIAIFKAEFLKHKMKKIVLILVAVLTVSWAKAQESGVSTTLAPAEADIYYRDLFRFDPESLYGPLLMPSNLTLQAFNSFKTPGIKFEMPDFNYRQPIFFQPQFSLNHPFLSAYSLNHAASYRLNDRLTITGSQFSANSIWNPVQTFDPNKMNIQGVNFQFEYKVSDKFRIGGGIQVNRNQPGI